VVEVAEVGRSDAPSGGDGGGCDEPVAGPDVEAGGGEIGPDAGMCASGEKAEGQRGEGGQDRLGKGPATRASRSGRPRRTVVGPAVLSSGCMMTKAGRS
jgi:hypothetical protein